MLQTISIADNYTISTYNIMWGIALIIGLVYLEYEFERNNISYKLRNIINLFIPVILLFSVIGARLFDYFVHRNKVDSLFNAGFTFYGGLILGGLTLLILSMIYKLNTYKVFNLLVPSLVIGHFFGRIGCFLGGCCYGKTTDCFLGIVFPKNSLVNLKYAEGVAVHPTQIYEALFLLLLFLFLIKIVSFNKRTANYLLFYGCFRFMIEYLRGDNRGILIKNIDLSPSQIISILLIIIAVLILNNNRYKIA